MNLYTGNGAHVDALGAGTTIAVTLPNNVLQGNAVVGEATNDSTGGINVASVKDQASTSAALDIQHNAATLTQNLVLWSFPNSPGGSRTFTATFSASTSSRGIQAFELSGAVETVLLVGTPAGNDSGAGTATSFDPTINTQPGISGAFVLSAAEGGTHQPSPAGAWTQLLQDTNNTVTTAYLISNTPSDVLSPSFTMSVADVWSVVIAAYMPAPQPAPRLQALRLGPGRRAPLGTAQPASLPVAGNVTVIVPLASLTLTGFAPSALAPRLVVPPVAGLVLTGLAPSVVVGIRVTVPTAALTLTGKVPTALTPRLVVPPVAALTLSGKVPQALAPRLVVPPNGALVLSAKVPQVVVTSQLVIQPPSGQLRLLGFAPLVRGTGSRGGGGTRVVLVRPPEPPEQDEEVEEFEVLDLLEELL